MDDNGGQRHPAWFRLDPEGPHRKSGGASADGRQYVFFCAKDGHGWPCPAERDREATR